MVDLPTRVGRSRAFKVFQCADIVVKRLVCLLSGELPSDFGCAFCTFDFETGFSRRRRVAPGLPSRRFYPPDQHILPCPFLAFHPGVGGYRGFEDVAICEISRPLWMILRACVFDLSRYSAH